MKNEKKDKFPYKVPEGYFEEMSKVWADEAIKVGTQKFVKLNRKYMAIAAMFLLSFGGLVVYQTIYSNKFTNPTEFAAQNHSDNLEINNQKSSTEEYNQLLATLLADTQPKSKKGYKEVNKEPQDVKVEEALEKTTDVEQTQIEKTEPQIQKSQEEKEADAILEYLKYYDVDIYESL